MMAVNNSEQEEQDLDLDEEESSSKESILSKVFSSCAGDPKGSVHRAWGVSLIFLVLYFILSIFEMLNLQTNGGSRALVLAAIWTGILHLILAILGTFVLKRFPTSFAIGFLVGILVVCVNQNIILFGIFHGYPFGNPKTNHAFASLCFTLAMVLAFFTAILVHFRNDLVVAPVDVKGIMRTTPPNAIHLESESEKEEAFDYERT